MEEKNISSPVADEWDDIDFSDIVDDETAMPDEAEPEEEVTEEPATDEPTEADQPKEGEPAEPTLTNNETDDQILTCVHLPLRTLNTSVTTLGTTPHLSVKLFKVSNSSLVGLAIIRP